MSRREVFSVWHEGETCVLYRKEREIGRFPLEEASTTYRIIDSSGDIWKVERQWPMRPALIPVTNEEVQYIVRGPRGARGELTYEVFRSGAVWEGVVSWPTDKDGNDNGDGGDNGNENGEDNGGGGGGVTGGDRGGASGRETTSWVAEIILGIYGVCCLGFAIWMAVLASNHSGMEEVFEVVTAEIKGTIWSPTGDPVVDFLVNGIILLFGVAVVAGTAVAILYVCLAALAVLIPLYLLVTLAQVSTGGAVLAIIIFCGGLWMFFRS